MTKKEYTDGTRKALVAAGVVVNDETLRNAIERAARHAKAKYGRADWTEEHAEGGFENGVYFYKEAEKDGGAKDARTFNRDRAFRT